MFLQYSGDGLQNSFITLFIHETTSSSVKFSTLFITLLMRLLPGKNKKWVITPFAEACNLIGFLVIFITC